MRYFGTELGPDDKKSAVSAQREPVYLHGVTIDYTNYRGERAMRRVIPADVFFGSSEHHPEPQWLMSAWDDEKKQARVFAMKDIHSWAPIGA